MIKSSMLSEALISYQEPNWPFIEHSNGIIEATIYFGH